MDRNVTQHVGKCVLRVTKDVMDRNVTQHSTTVEQGSPALLYPRWSCKCVRVCRASGICCSCSSDRTVSQHFCANILQCRHGGLWQNILRVPSSQQTCCSLASVKKFLARNHKTANCNICNSHPPHSPELVHMISCFFPP